MPLLRRRTRVHLPEVSPQQVQQWRARRDSLTAHLAASPEGDWAWLWRVRIHVLDYLIDRYRPEDQNSPEPVTVDSGAQALPTNPDRCLSESTAPYDLSPATPAKPDDVDDPIRAKQQSLLASISQANAERYARRRVIPGPMDMPAVQRKVTTDELADYLSAMDECSYRAIRQMLAIELGLPELTDEMFDEQTIRAILAEHGIDPDDSR